jgi:hypothetical protein
MKQKLKPLQIFGRKVFAWDIILITIVVVLNTLVFNGFLPLADPPTVDVHDLRLFMHPTAIAIAIWAGWVVSVMIAKTWRPRFAGSGLPEYVTIGKISIGLLAVFAFSALFFKLDMPRLFLSSTFISVTLSLVVARWLTQKWLHGQRRQGLLTNRVALLGPVKQTVAMAHQLQKNPIAGYQPVLMATFIEQQGETTEKKLSKLGLPSIVFDPANPTHWQYHDIDAVVVIGSEHLDARSTKRLSWSLEGTNIELVVAPALVDFAGDRVTTIDVAGSPFLRIQSPQFVGFKYLFKTAMDFAFGLLLLVIALPIMLIAGLAIWLEDRGPIFFFQKRVGRNERTFTMFKLRSMKVGAEKLHEQMMATNNESPNSKMYKNPNDPRVTRVGKFIRRWSIDELPQIFNVLNGTMSLVGPRPPLPSEVAQYESDAKRRLKVSPGLTGPWQVGGRASLTWDETVALDLDYVENWSPLRDLVLLGKTLRTILKKDGAH